MRRELFSSIFKDLDKKIILLSGPRQVGKTTLSKTLYPSFEYFNYDASIDRIKITKASWNRQSPLLVFDEIHKMPNWKRWLKGIYDTEGIRPRILVTGSSRLDIARKMGDSLAGRHFQYRLFPFDIHELRDHIKPSETFNRLMAVGGFPEPFSENSLEFWGKWNKSHLDLILRQDLLDLEAVRSISSIETLIALLRERIGSPISYASLARDLEKDPSSVKRWLQLLENLFVIFKVSPYSKSINRSIRKEPKYYFYDNALVLGDSGAKLENLIAIGLKKHLTFLEDTKGQSNGLFFLKDKEGHEIDFCVVQNGKVTHLIESKWSDPNPTPHFSRFQKSLPQASCFQLISEIDKKYKNAHGHETVDVKDWFCKKALLEP